MIVDFLLYNIVYIIGAGQLIEVCCRVISNFYLRCHVISNCVLKFVAALLATVTYVATLSATMFRIHTTSTRNKVLLFRYFDGC